MAFSPPLRDRISAAATELRSQGIDALVVTPSADMVYLAGLPDHTSERPTLLIISGDDDPTLIAPALEAASASGRSDIRVLTYQEGQDPYALAGREVGALRGSRRVALSDQAWASVLLSLQSTFPGAEFTAASPILRTLRMIKSSAEIELLAQAGAMADRAFGALVELRFAGRTERSIQRELAELLRGQGLDVGGWGPIVGSGPNGASPHHTAGDREIHDGDAVVLDFGGTLQHYYADITRTVHVGTPSDEFRRVYDAVRTGQEAGVRAVRPGVPAERVDSAARTVIEEAGFGPYFIHRTGHGLGLDGHEEPYIISGNRLPLATGMVFSIEPGAYLPGRFGVRIEDIVAVTDVGARRLNTATRELLVVH